MADSIKILILDDEEDTKDLFQQEFRHQIEKGDYSFSFSVSSGEVSNMLEKESFDIFITDINIAGFDGINFISQLKTAYPLMKTIVTSAYGDMNTLRAVMRSGAHDFVIKPIDFQDLALTIKNTVNTVLELKRAAVTAKKLSAISDELTLSAKLQKSILPGNSLKRGDVDVWADSIPDAPPSMRRWRRALQPPSRFQAAPGPILSLPPQTSGIPAGTFSVAATAAASVRFW